MVSSTSFLFYVLLFVFNNISSHILTSLKLRFEHIVLMFGCNGSFWVPHSKSPPLHDPRSSYFRIHDAQIRPPTGKTGLCFCNLVPHTWWQTTSARIFWRGNCVGIRRFNGRTTADVILCCCSFGFHLRCYYQ
jgi:hypothetical protein